MQSQRKGPERPEKNRKRRLWVVLPTAAIVAGGVLLWQARSDAPGDKGTKAPEITVRTATVRSGSLAKTIRLTGTTSPERFASLLSPQLRGGRHGPGGGGGGGGGGSSSGGGSGSSGGSSSSSGSSSSGSSSGSSSSSVSSSAASGSTSGALATALNRFSSPTSSSRSSSSGSSSASSSSGGSSLGSTASSIPSGGGGGGGGGGTGFELILQKVAEPGSRVKKGDVVAEFDRQYMLLRLDDYRASLEQLQTNLQSLKASLDVDKKAHDQSVADAKAALEKARYDLKTIPVQSAITTEQLRLAEEEAAARYKQLLSEVKYKDISQQAQWKMANLDADENKVEFQRSQANADRMVFRAPIDGLVVMGTTFRGSEFSQIRAGDEIHPGSMFMRIVDPSSMVVNAFVNQVDIEMLRVGARATVRFDAYPDLEVPAHLYSIGAMPKTGGFRAAYVKEIPVTLKLDRLDPRVVPDLSVSVDVAVSAEAQATVAPLESIFRDKPGGEPYVFVRGAAGWERRPVELGLTNNIAAVVRSGLRPGEVIASERPALGQKK